MGLIDGQIDKAVHNADFNHDGIPDFKQGEELSLQLFTAVNDLEASVNGAVATAALLKLQALYVKQSRTHTVDTNEVIAALGELFGSVDPHKLTVALQDLKAVKESIHAYMHPPKVAHK